MRIGFTMLMVWALSACSPIYQTNYDYEPPSSKMGKVCIAQCIQSKSMCQQMCKMREDNCRVRAHEDAIVQYENYRDQQRRIDGEIKKSVSDFDRGYACSETCDCTNAFNECYGACGGQVIENKVCVAFCDKA